jgi:hypothetical protein
MNAIVESCYDALATGSATRCNVDLETSFTVRQRRSPTDQRCVGRRADSPVADDNVTRARS